MTLFGVDISNHQGRVDWDIATKTGGVEFAIVKATEGVSFDDAWFGRNWADLGRVGIPRGAYHYALPSENTAKAEADHFLNAVAKVGLLPGDLVALDMEDPDFPVGRNVGDWTLSWLEMVEAALGFAPLLYTYPSYKTERKLLNPELAHYPLWWAAYDEPERYSTAPWPRWAIRQYTAEGKVPGLGTRIDCNRYLGNADQLRALGKPGAVAPVGPESVTARVNAEGNAIVEINFGGWVKDIQGYVVVDAGVSAIGNDGKVYHRTVRTTGFEPWVKEG